MDESTVTYGNHIGVNAVVRNCKGFALGIMSKRIAVNFTPYLAERPALLEGLRFARQGLMINAVD